MGYLQKYKIGVVSHYFENLKMAVIFLSAEIVVGDTIFFEQQENSFSQKIGEIKKEDENVRRGKSGESVVVKTEREVYAGTEVYTTLSEESSS